MTLIQKLLGGIVARGLVNTDPSKVVVPKTRYEKSLEYAGPSHLSKRDHEVPLFRSNLRRLERNKYAPWGRGDLSGLKTA